MWHGVSNISLEQCEKVVINLTRSKGLKYNLRNKWTWHKVIDRDYYTSPNIFKYAKQRTNKLGAEKFPKIMVQVLFLGQTHSPETLLFHCFYLKIIVECLKEDLSKKMSTRCGDHQSFIITGFEFDNDRLCWL